jgi:hypothetical protein
VLLLNNFKNGILFINKKNVRFDSVKKYTKNIIMTSCDMFELFYKDLAASDIDIYNFSRKSFILLLWREILN